MKEEFLEILNRADKEAILPFLKKLTIEERRELVPVLKKEYKQYDSWRERRDAGDRLPVLQVAQFVCFTATDAKRLNQWDIPNTDVVEQIMEWYCPEWFIRLFTEAEFYTNRTYETVSKWQDKGYVEPSPELIVLTLPNAIHKYDRETRTKYITTVDIERYPITLDEHIWYLFEYPSNIKWEDGYMLGNKNKLTGKGNWCDLFIKYASEGRIDRMNVLRESLLAVNRNFNKVLTGWFTDLFMAMEPTKEEQLALLDELFATLACVQTKPVNTTLTLFKQLCTEDDFKEENLLEYLPVLLSSETRAILKNTLALTEAILKKKTNYQKELCMAVTRVFLVKDEAIQKKTADIITRYMKPDTGLKEQLAVYADSILMSIRPKLEGYLVMEQTKSGFSGNQPVLFEKQPLLNERLPEINSFEDFAFFASQALDLSEACQFDLFAGELIRWGNVTDASNVIMLEPAFQKMYKVLSKWETPPMSGILHFILLEYADYLLDKYPEALHKTLKQKKKFLRSDKERLEKSNYYKTRIGPFAKRDIPSYYTGFKEIGSNVLEKIKKQDTVPLLSTPTHLPAWIHPVVLVERLIQHQQAGIEPASMDLQLGLQRCAFEQTEEALIVARQSLQGEYKDLMADSGSNPFARHTI
jgi:hypothetical protein